MGLEGSLSDSSAVDVFHEVLSARKSGSLSLSRGDTEYAFQFLFASLTGLEGKSAIPRLLHVLARAGRCGAEKLKELSDLHPALPDLETTLIKNDLFTRKELRDHRIAAIKEAMFDALAWTEGRYSFADVRPPKDLPQPEINLSTTELLLEGLRSISDYGVVERGLSSKRKTRIKAPQFSRIEAQMRTLRPEEGFILSRIDGTVTVDQVCDLSSLPREQTLRVIYGLVAADLLEYDEPHPALPRKTAAAPALAKEASPAIAEGAEEWSIDLTGVGLREEPEAPAARPSPGRPAPRASGATPRPVVAPAAPARPSLRPSGGIPRPAPEETVDETPDAEGLTPRERRAKARESIDTAKKFIDREAWPNAVPLLRDAVRISERDPEAWHLLGVALGKAPGSRKEAEEALMKAIDLNHKNAENYVELALLYRSSGDEERSRLQFENALRWDPVHPVARKELKREGLTAIKEDLGEAFGGVRESVEKLLKDVFKAKRKG